MADRPGGYRSQLLPSDWLPTMPRFPTTSRAADTVTDSVYTTLAPRAAASGRVVHPLHVGDTYLEPPLLARSESLLTQDHPGLHRYAPVQGPARAAEGHPSTHQGARRLGTWRSTTCR
jgi:hypothetical protein